MKKPYRRLSSYIVSSETKTLFKNGNRYECDKTTWTFKTIYSVTIFNKDGKCLGHFSTEDKNKANEYYMAN